MQAPELDLTSVYAKLFRAEEHFKQVDIEIAKWLESGRYETFMERSANDTRLGIAVLQVGPPPDLVRWALIIGDCLNNLRAALDHLIIAFTKLNAVYIPPAKKKRVTFVIVDSPDEFTAALKGNLEGLAARFAVTLELLQPFRRTHPTLPPLLSIIRDLSNANKHRLLQVAGAGVVHVEGHFEGHSGKGTKATNINPEPIQHNDIICVIESSEPDPHLAIKTFGANVEISIWHNLRNGSTNPLEGRTGYSTLLPLLIDEVRHAIEAFKFSV